MFATAGSCIKLWDAHKYTLHQEISSGTVGGLSWAQNGQCIASLGESSTEINLFAVNAKSAANIGLVRVVESPSCLKFSCRSSHYLGVGSKDGLVALWNLKTNSQKKAFSVTDSAISHIAFSHNDSHIAAASKGNLYVLSTMNNSIGGPFKIFTKAVTEVAYSNVKKSLVGCSSEGGSVALFDAHASKLVHTFTNSHASPVSSVTFSPINELLMISVGYDKKLVCYSIQTKKQILSHKSPVPLTSAALLPGCQQIALGGMTGEIFIHDLRTIRKPLATVQAHDRAVSYILLQPAVKHIPDGASGSTKATKAKTSKKEEASGASAVSTSEEPSEVVPCEKVERPVTVDKNKPESATNPSEDVLSTIFSPVRASEQTTHVDIGPIDNMGSSALSPLRSTSTVIRDAYSSPGAKNTVLVEEIFSPVRNSSCDNAPVDLHDVFSPVRTSQSDTPFMEKELSSPYYPKEVQKVQVHLDPSNTEKSPTAFKFPGKHILPDSSSQEIIHKENVDPNASPSVVTESTNKVENTAHVASLGAPLPKVTLSPVHPLGEKKLVCSPSPRKSNRKLNIEASESRPVFQSTSSISEFAKNTVNSILSELDENIPTPTSDQLKNEDKPSQLSEGTKIGGAASHMEMELIRNCVSEVMEDFQDNVNQRMMHLQFVVTKQFLQLKDMMQQIQNQHSLTETVLLENERLRKENAFLRKTF